MSYTDAQIKRAIRTGGGLKLKGIKPRKGQASVLSRLTRTPKRRRTGTLIKSYFV